MDPTATATRDRIFLDWNAGAPLAATARAAMLAALEDPGNASSVHAEGRAARARVEAARRAIARALGVEARGVTFTSGGSEANVTALSPGVGPPGAPPAARLLVSAVEHPSVLAGGRFPADRVETIPVDADGRVRLDPLHDRLARLAADGGRALVSVMAANNETGVIQPVEAVARIVRAHGATLHVDAVQVFGRLPFDVPASGADLVTVSAHKIGGPRGVGAVVAADTRLVVPPLVTGGGQEDRRRAGTENVAAIAGFGAVAAGIDDEIDRWRATAAIRDWFERQLRLRFEDAIVLGSGAPRIPNTTAFALAGIPAETLVIALDLEGVAVSAGSACSSGKMAASHVVAAMAPGDARLRGAVRVSVGPATSLEEVGRVLEVLEAIAARVRPGPGRATTTVSTTRGP